MKPALWILICTLLAGGVRCTNLRDVFIEGRIYFIDADCYSRMTRVQIVDQHPGTIVRHHDFENFPTGVNSHTTAPMDYLVVGLRRLVDFGLSLTDRGGSSVLRGQTLDVAGALVSPLLGMLTCIWLGIWARRWGLSASYVLEGERTPNEPKSLWGVVPFFFAVCPILVHGTALGRPDHQSLLILVLAVALGAESRQAAAPSRAWAIIGGLAWAFALWVSLYEPLVLLGAVLLAWLACKPRQLRAPERLFGLAAMLVLGGIAWLLEGWRIEPPDRAMLGYLANWNSTIGELGHPTATTIFRWLGLSCVVAPVLLVLAAREHRRALLLLALLALVFGLTCWQLRWGYFLALVFAMTLPWQLAVLRRGWLAWLVFFLSLWPMLQEWDERLFPDDAAQQQIATRRLESVRLREVAQQMRSDEPRPFMAAWWMSPAVAYWSGQDGVAGSSHESLAGIIDSARVYLAPDGGAAVPILRARGVRWLVAGEATGVIENSATLLGLPAPEQALATLLVQQPHSTAEFLRPVFANDLFKLFAVDETNLPP